MFSKILIANRGEIACRIVRTARRMNIRTVAVFSDADRDAPHVEMADEAVRIGPAPAAESYLSIAALLRACRETGAEAVHPGYGFLSERADFAEALAAERIAFIGPNPGAIRAMGDKIASKRAARAAGVSTVPGSDGALADPEEATRAAERIGYPVMLKASAGGGGKGMRLAADAAEVRDGFARARSEAASSFGDDRVFVEKFVVDPRHIEIQVLGDRHGHLVHLGERECSIQRRNQKVVEESPSTLLDPETRAAMGAQALALCRAVGYDSAGTVEFIAGQDRAFFFLEMNTRLQVEHPVTELVTGLDLVEEMIRVAAGETLRFAQADVALRGWAVETRIYAEDPTRGFLPSTGRLATYRPPVEGVDEGVTVRLDGGVAEGGEVAMFYDPMIAKLVTHAPTRAAAIEAQARALDAFALRGIRHNIAFLAALMAHPRWRAGRLSTGFIGEEFPGGFSEAPPSGDLARRFAALAASIDQIGNARRRRISGQLPTPRAVRFARDRRVRIGAHAFALTVEAVEAGWRVAFDDGAVVTLSSRWRPGEPVWHGVVDGVSMAAEVLPVPNGVVLSHAGCKATAKVYTRREAELAALMRAKTVGEVRKSLLCPMPGVVSAMHVVVGQHVKAGEPVAVVEAMKMENVLRAERDGTVAKLHARTGDILALDAAILDFA